jgi:periplasmic protein TonB
MQSSLTTGSCTALVTPSVMSPRIVSTVAVVALVHTALIAAMMQATKRPSRPDAIASPVITALLTEQPAPAQSAAVAVATPPAPRPATPRVVKKKVEPHAAPPRVSPATTPTPSATPMPSQAAAPDTAATHETADAQPTKASETTSGHAAATAPANSRETLAISAPRSVRHIDCRIVKPDYPVLSRRRGETGTADVRFVVGPTGAIETVELAKSSGYARLDAAVLGAMRASSCRPYIENGAPVRVTYTQPFGFRVASRDDVTAE